MSDLLATAEDLRNLIKADETSLPDAEAMVLLELATGAIQGATEQDLVDRQDDEVVLMGTTEQWFDLPQRPVTAVTSVAIEGVPITDYKLFGDRMWRRCGWAIHSDEPAIVEVTYSHGFFPGDSKLQPARTAALTLAARMSENPTGVVGMSIDDYKTQYAQSSVADLAGLVPPILAKSLRRLYGTRGRFVRFG